ncbi:hypothetical protein GCM10010493_46170 [Streptomyces lavendulae subsp. grasserius]
MDFIAELSAEAPPIPPAVIAHHARAPAPSAAPTVRSIVLRAFIAVLSSVRGNPEACVNAEVKAAVQPKENEPAPGFTAPWKPPHSPKERNCRPDAPAPRKEAGAWRVAERWNTAGPSVWKHQSVNPVNVRRVRYVTSLKGFSCCLDF